MTNIIPILEELAHVYLVYDHIFDIDHKNANEVYQTFLKKINKEDYDLINKFHFEWVIPGWLSKAMSQNIIESYEDTETIDYEYFYKQNIFVYNWNIYSISWVMLTNYGLTHQHNINDIKVEQVDIEDLLGNYTIKQEELTKEIELIENKKKFVIDLIK